MPKASSAGMFKGGNRPTGKVTFGDGRWVERSGQSGGTERGFYEVDCTMPDGSIQPLALEFGPKDWYDGQAYIELFDDDHPEAGGKFLDVDDENPYLFGSKTMAMRFFNSLEREGFSVPKLDRLGENPNGLSGLTVMLTEVPTGRTYESKDKQGRMVQREEKSIEVEKGGIVEDGTGGGGKKGGSKPAVKSTTTTGKPKPKPVPVEEPEEEEEEEESEEEEAEEAEQFDPATQLALDTVEAMLADPKGHVKTYSKTENGGALTVKQIETSALTSIKTKDSKLKQKAWAVIRGADFFTEYAEGRWKFNAKKGLVSAL